MINWLHSRLRRPEAGWDPVPAEHAREYCDLEWEHGAQVSLLDRLEQWTCGLRGKTVLDLGGGPGQYSIAFAQRGAIVTWHDVSARYRDIARTKAKAAAVDVQFSVGYMDEAPTLLGEQFDLVFNRICWNYGRGDRSFGRVIWDLVKPGGSAYIDTTPDSFKYGDLALAARFRVWLNRRVWWKIGHPFPPHGRLASLFLAYPLDAMLVDYSTGLNDRILLRKRS